MPTKNELFVLLQLAGILAGILAAAVVVRILVKPIKGRPGTNYKKRFKDEIKVNLDIAKGYLRELLDYVIGLVILGLLIWLLVWIWSNWNKEWACYTKDGEVVYTKSEPDDAWIEGEYGTLYPREQILYCYER